MMWTSEAEACPADADVADEVPYEEEQLRRGWTGAYTFEGFELGGACSPGCVSEGN